jgi:hypothetical protein
MSKESVPYLASPTWSARAQSSYHCTWQILGLVHDVGTAGMTPVGMSHARVIDSDTPPPYRH